MHQLEISAGYGYIIDCETGRQLGMNVLTRSTVFKRVFSDVCGIDIESSCVNTDASLASLAVNSLSIVLAIQKMEEQGYLVDFANFEEDMSLREFEASFSIAQNRTVVSHVDDGVHCLTPGQNWFLNISSMEANNWNAVYVFEIRETTFDWQRLITCLGAMMDRHTVMRTEYHSSGDQNICVLSGKALDELLQDAIKELSTNEKFPMSIENITNEVSNGINAGAAPLFRLVKVENQLSSQSHLIFIAHHLIFDSYSVDLFWREISKLYSGQSLLPLNDNYAIFTRRLLEYAKSTKIKRDLALFSDPKWTQIPPMRFDFDPEKAQNEVSSNRTLSLKLGSSDTKTLLQLAKSTSSTIEDVLLFALSQTFCGFIGHDALSVIRISLGRPYLSRVTEVNTSNILGWMSLSSLLYLERVKTTGSIAQDFSFFLKSLRGQPNQGLDIELLYLVDELFDPPLFSPKDINKIVFNFLGDLSHRSQEFLDGNIVELKDLFHLAEPAENDRLCSFKLASYIVGEQLYMNWEYSAALHRETTVKELMKEYKGHLETLILAIDFN